MLGRAIQLDVYVRPGCAMCMRAKELAEDVDRRYRDVDVHVLDPDDGGSPEVFAVPTFVLNGDLLSLGNPAEADLRERIDSLLAEARYHRD